MKTTFDTDSILFQLLDGKTDINGGVYLRDERPEDSHMEDIVINTIDLTQNTHPQIGTSNVNIYVADTSKRINGKMQVSANAVRLKQLTEDVLSVIRSEIIPGLTITPGNMIIMYDQTVKQHFANIRIDWNIQID